MGQAHHVLMGHQMSMMCMFRKMRYIPDMALAHMRAGCGRNKKYAIMQSIATID